MPEIEVETEEGSEKVNIEFYCSACGKGICNNYTAGRTFGRGQPYFHAEPCDCQTKTIAELEKEIEDLQEQIIETEQEAQK